MSKRRYNAKKIAQTPSLKRNLAMVIAEFSPRDPQINMTNLLAYGHRGYISYSEDELCKIFDKLYNDHVERLNFEKSHLAEKISEKGKNSWEVSSLQREIASLDAHLAKFKEMADQIFEEKVLL